MLQLTDRVLFFQSTQHDPQAAMVCGLIDGGKVNLSVWSNTGSQSTQKGVPFVGCGQDVPTEGPFCELPYSDATETEAYVPTPEVDDDEEIIGDVTIVPSHDVGVRDSYAMGHASDR